MDIFHIFALITILVIVILASRKIKTLETNVERKNDQISSEKSKAKFREEKNEELQRHNNKQSKRIKDYQYSLNKSNASVHKSLIFVTNLNTRNKATNVKVKTVIDENGNTTLYPTIRRKVEGVWKEIPVYLIYNEPK